MWKEFKEFAIRGNLVDMAFAVVIGTGFTKIVDSLVRDLMMPIFGVLMGGVNLTSKSFILGKAVVRYGAFLQTLLDFFIIAFSIFMAMKVVNRIRGKEKIKEEKQKDTLEDIRDLLNERLPAPKPPKKQHIQIMMNPRKTDKPK
ncbi:large-conductance mechanosensitive channel protein MscL [Bacillus carboniphilus]|uniref:Large-conductance mechanosensitive channel n=1 Tax=Bacillus carboniphilus TaxID=86663 RepID=A0ABN0W7C0_9BACI